MEIRTTLPESDIEQILVIIGALTDDPIISLTDGKLGPEVKTGRVCGHTWQIRRARSGWRVLFKHQWVS